MSDELFSLSCVAINSRQELESHLSLHDKLKFVEHTVNSRGSTSMKTSLLTLLFLIVFYPIHAQDLDTVTITGRVVDQNAAVIPGAQISATLTSTGMKRTAT